MNHENTCDKISDGLQNRHESGVQGMFDTRALPISLDSFSNLWSCLDLISDNKRTKFQGKSSLLEVYNSVISVVFFPPLASHKRRGCDLITAHLSLSLLSCQKWHQNKSWQLTSFWSIVENAWISAPSKHAKDWWRPLIKNPGRSSNHDLRSAMQESFTEYSPKSFTSRI